MKQPLLLSALVVAVPVFTAGPAHASDWVDRPLTLGLYAFTADGSLGVGQTGNGDVGSGANVEAALGLPVGFEAGFRLGIPFGATGRDGFADSYARTFDQVNRYEMEVRGALSSVPTPELRLQKSIVDVGFAAAALDLRAVIPTGDGTQFVIAPGARVRFRLPRLIRVDTGMYFPIGFTHPTSYSVDVPLAVWFQARNLFFGPETGLFYVHWGDYSRTDIHAGLGLGHTFGGVVDVKAEVITTRVNDPDWSKFIGAGVGIGLYLP